MGCCLTRHPINDRLFVSNKVGQETTLPSSDGDNVRRQQQFDAWNASMIEAANHRSSEVMRQAFLDGTLNPDPRCPLDARQLYTLIMSWNVINRNLSVTAIDIFVR